MMSLPRPLLPRQMLPPSLQRLLLPPPLLPLPPWPAETTTRTITTATTTMITTTTTTTTTARATTTTAIEGDNDTGCAHPRRLFAPSGRWRARAYRRRVGADVHDMRGLPCGRMVAASRSTAPGIAPW